MSKTPRKKQKVYGLFSLTAAIYTTGVIVFSVWSYFQQRCNLREAVDHSLINATHATEQILGRIFIECAVEANEVYGLGSASNQQNLDRFASNCHFECLGVIGYKKSATWKLIAGGGSMSGQNTLKKSLAILEPLDPSLSTTIRQLAKSGKETIRLQTLMAGENKELRVAIRYHSIGTDRGYALLVAQSTHDVKRLTRALAIRTAAIALFLHIMVFPLILLYSRTQKKAREETLVLNTRLQQDVARQKERETELKDAMHDLERFNTVAVGRETRVIELKAEINTLLEQMKRQKRYNIDQTE